MIRILTVFVLFLLLIIGTGCTVKETQKTAQPETPEEMQKTAQPAAQKEPQKTVQPEKHAHEYPFTEDMGNYHVRLEVNHTIGTMIILFEEFSEEPVKLLRFKTIRGKITFPNRSEKIETFVTIKYMAEKWISREAPGIYMASKEWLKSADAFKLELTASLKGQDHNIIFNYQKPAETD
jgi:hypothetical protein